MYMYTHTYIYNTYTHIIYTCIVILLMKQVCSTQLTKNKKYKILFIINSTRDS